MPFRSAFSQLFTQDTIIAWVVFCLVILVMTGAMGYSWYRGRKGQGPLKLAEANRLELGYVGVLAGMVAFLVVSSFAANAKDYPSPSKPAAAAAPKLSFVSCRSAAAARRFSSSMSSSTGSTSNRAGTSPCTSAWNAKASLGQGVKPNASFTRARRTRPRAASKARRG